MPLKVVNASAACRSIQEFWSPRIAAELNGQYVKLARLQGEFVMHQHDAEDELFFVIDGQLFIELPDETIELNRGEFVVIPRGVPHRPYAPGEVSVLLFEPASTVNTGDVESELTVRNPKPL